MSNLTILETSIRSNENLYSLNDLHRASGSEDKHRPALFMRNQQTLDLIDEINLQNSQSANSISGKTPNLVASKIVRGGKDLTVRGYWVCEELVLAYAMWISPKFHLIVLRAFLAMHRNEPKQLTLPLVSDELKQAMAKMVTYASQYANFQQAITSAQLEEQKRLVEFFFSSIPNGDSYLFVFNKNIQQDIQQASDLLHKLITQ
ncbi:TPA: KilA-N domain-containing protein [Haemophilus influenzae]